MADDIDYSLPEVSGISPNEGPPGTKITIRGENLGENKDDVIGKHYKMNDNLNKM